MTESKTIALVTGASSGLGAEFCRQLASRCDVIIAVARRRERLVALADELAGRVEVHPVVADLSSVEGVARCLEALRQQGPVDILVNNAGNSTFGRFDALEIGGQLDQVRLHVEAALSLCRGAIPFMRERGGGQIVNVASLAAFLPMKDTAVYGAAKAFLLSFSDSLQYEVREAGIHVQCLCPGLTRTGIHYTEEMADFDPARTPAELWMEADTVVAASLEAFGGPTVVVPGEHNIAAARAGLQARLDSLQ